MWKLKYHFIEMKNRVETFLQTRIIKEQMKEGWINIYNTHAQSKELKLPQEKYSRLGKSKLP